MSESKKRNLNVMEEDPNDSDSTSDSDEDGLHPEAYTGDEVSPIFHNVK